MTGSILYFFSGNFCPGKCFLSSFLKYNAHISTTGWFKKLCLNDILSFFVNLPKLSLTCGRYSSYRLNK